MYFNTFDNVLKKRFIEPIAKITFFLIFIPCQLLFLFMLENIYANGKTLLNI